MAYRRVQPDYFDRMPRDSGVLICPLVNTGAILPSAVRPGDIDILIIPYENDELILHRVVAVEAKALRVQFVRQGKSPNQFGFSQASSLLELGFPYVAVAHLIVSDQSPPEHWREMSVARTIDEFGRIELLGKQTMDMMPAALIERALGRLQNNCCAPELGLISAYLDWRFSTKGHSVWHPDGRAASLNRKVSLATLEAVASFYEENALKFLDTPRFDPPSSQ